MMGTLAVKGLNEYFHMYRCQLNFAMFCATSALGISWQHLNHPNLHVRSVYRFHVHFHVRSVYRFYVCFHVRSVYGFHVCFHVRIILHHLGISLPHKDGLARLKILTFKVRITVSVMAMALMQMKHGCMGIGFIRKNMVFLVMEERQQKGLHQTILHDGLPSLKVLQEKVLKR